MVILEAQALGIPVIATRSGAITEIVQHDVTGLLVSEGAVADMADAAITLIWRSDLARRLGAEGRRRVLQQHGLDSVLRAHASLYADLLGRTR